MPGHTDSELTVPSMKTVPGSQGREGGKAFFLAMITWCGHRIPRRWQWV